MKQTENFENLNSIKSQLHYHHGTYYSCSYVVNSIHEHFMETDLHLQVSQHQASLKHENFTPSYHSYTTLLPQNILQLRLHFRCSLHFTAGVTNMVLAGTSRPHGPRGSPAGLFWQ